jgi:hypothetical protein
VSSLYVETSSQQLESATVQTYADSEEVRWNDGITHASDWSRGSVGQLHTVLQRGSPGLVSVRLKRFQRAPDGGQVNIAIETDNV